MFQGRDGTHLIAPLTFLRSVRSHQNLFCKKLQMQGAQNLRNVKRILQVRYTIHSGINPKMNNSCRKSIRAYICVLFNFRTEAERNAAVIAFHDSVCSFILSPLPRDGVGPLYWKFRPDGPLPQLDSHLYKLPEPLRPMLPGSRP